MTGVDVGKSNGQPGKQIVFEPTLGFDLHDLPPILVKNFHTTPERLLRNSRYPPARSFLPFALPWDPCPRRAAVAQCRASHAPSLKSHPDRPRRQASFPCQQSGISNANTCLQT